MESEKKNRMNKLEYLEHVRMGSVPPTKLIAVYEIIKNDRIRKTEC
jgi:hypothetical protein